MYSRCILIGPDRPGLLADWLAALTSEGLAIGELRCSTVPDRALIQVVIDDATTSRDHFAAVARAVGLEARFAADAPAPAPTWVLTVLKSGSPTPALAAALRAAADHGFDVDRVAPLSSRGVQAVEVALRAGPDAEERALRARAQTVSAQLDADVVLQREGPGRRFKRLLVMDVDSTVIQQEVIDELARAAGAFDRVAEITARAMDGKLDFRASLTERVATLAGVDARVFEDVLQRIQPTPGVEDLIAAVHRMGGRVAVISGGFIQVVEPLRKRLDIDYAFANTLEVIGGRLTGRLTGPIVDGTRKAQLVETLAQTERIHLDQVIAVGDGANDLPMLERAGTGVAFNAKPSVQKSAPCSVNQPRIDAILHLLGPQPTDP